MSLESAVDFARKVSSDAVLAARVAAAVKAAVNSAAADAFSALGRQEGFDFTAEEALAARIQILQSQPCRRAIWTGWPAACSTRASPARTR